MDGQIWTILPISCVEGFLLKIEINLMLMFLSMYQQNVRQVWDSNLRFFGISKLPSNFIEGLLVTAKVCDTQLNQ